MHPGNSLLRLCDVKVISLFYKIQIADPRVKIYRVQNHLRVSPPNLLAVWPVLLNTPKQFTTYG
jgi:hypothetical protein